jgi:hypothetical protein
MEKFYIAGNYAEEMSEGIVHLTEDEHAAVVKFLKQLGDSWGGFTGGYCGSSVIGEEAFEDEAEARYWVGKDKRYPCSYCEDSSDCKNCTKEQPH